MSDTAPLPPPRPTLWRRGLRAALRLPALVLVAIYFLIDDVVLAAFRPLVAWASGLRLFLRFAVFLRRLPPYPTLVLFLVPFAVLEPFKIVGLWLMATGRFTPGLITLAVAHILSIVLVERLFHATRDKLLTIPWFAWGYVRVMRLYDWSLGRLRATEAWRRAERALRAIRAGLRAAIERARGSAVFVWARRRIGAVRPWILRLGARLRRRT
ncbi:hypothetical protein [Pinisolibacter aquiterrae]|uniref:hypothetical protein n=1 Tax=Pinisolibacter aquiterrae TaxID=2815579 RepID=UPI001C3CE056|nr:hypothetical protein [Pinisolibacter aquiterrae]MBV5266057.1 hypothetical protein [Pinisolibacter aquiterrae]MCC8233650.1 hypothetical protein [Pinisolibacter aquiterrae]